MLAGATVAVYLDGRIKKLTAWKVICRAPGLLDGADLDYCLGERCQAVQNRMLGA